MRRVRGYVGAGKSFYDDGYLRRELCGIRGEEERCGSDDTSSQFGSVPHTYIKSFLPLPSSSPPRFNKMDRYATRVSL